MSTVKIINMTGWIVPGGLAIFVLFSFSLGGEPENSLTIDKIQIDPIAQGKNVVKVLVKNNSDNDRIFGIHIYTFSPNLGKEGVGWGTTFFDRINANQSQWSRFAFKIQGPVTEQTWFRFRCYDAGLASAFDEDSFSKDKANCKQLKEIKYFAKDLPQQKDLIYKPAASQEEQDVEEFIQKLQMVLRDKNVQSLWDLFSTDYIQAEWQNRQSILKAVLNREKPFISFYPDISVLETAAIEKTEVNEDVMRVTLERGNALLSLNLIQDGDQLKLDWMAGYDLPVIAQQNWQERLIPTMEVKETDHFDIYYFKGTTAAREVKHIAEQREKAYHAISEFIGKESNIRVRCVFFEDEETKYLETGHQGKGWAFDNTIVEVYNKDVRLDPYHETTHILMRPQGSPPALFNEGFAVYMSEKLGAAALLYLGGKNAGIDEQAAKLDQMGKWIQLEELITYDNIGSQGDMTLAAYAESASFVKYLITKYGKEKFLRAYATLKNSNDKQAQQLNIQALEVIYGKTLQELKDKWMRTIRDKNHESGG
jgi:hypothetical protein